MSKSLIVILAVALGISLAAPAFADPPTEKSLQSSQTTSKAKTYTDGRTLADYNIQKE